MKISFVFLELMEQYYWYWCH